MKIIKIIGDLSECVCYSGTQIQHDVLETVTISREPVFLHQLAVPTEHGLLF